MSSSPQASRLLGLLLASGDTGAVRRVVRAMKASGGNVRAAAAALEVHEVTLHRWLDLVPLWEASALRRGIGKRPLA